MILEGIVTTLGVDGLLNIAPMGPSCEGDWSRFTIRPFRTSTTYRNLKAHGEGVLHVTDDVLLMARAAIGPVIDAETRPARVVRGQVLQVFGRHYEFRVTRLDDHDPRASFFVETVASGRSGELFGLNRAKHAVVEAAILATRRSLTPRDQASAELDRLEPLVLKTGGPAERQAFDLLRSYIEAEDDPK